MVDKHKGETKAGDPTGVRRNVLGNMFTGLLLRLDAKLMTEKDALAEIGLFNEAAPDFRTSLEELQELADKSRDWLANE